MSRARKGLHTFDSFAGFKPAARAKALPLVKAFVETFGPFTRQAARGSLMGATFGAVRVGVTRAQWLKACAEEYDAAKPEAGK